MCQLNPDVPRWLDEVVSCLLSKDPADRFQSAEEVAEVCKKRISTLGELPTKTHAPACHGAQRPSSRRLPYATRVLFIFAILGSLVAFWYLNPRAPVPDAVRREALPR